MVLKDVRCEDAGYIHLAWDRAQSRTRVNMRSGKGKKTVFVSQRPDYCTQSFTL